MTAGLGERIEIMNNKKAFTLAEVLITLAIIGVVAAITIPTVITNYQKQMYVTQLRKNYNNITRGFKTAMARDGVTSLSDTQLWASMNKSWNYPGDLKTNENFMNELLKIFNIVAVYSDIDIPDEYKIKYKSLNGADLNSLISIFLADGTGIGFEFYKKPAYACCNKINYGNLSGFQKACNTQTKLWKTVGRIYIDVNGIKVPNTLGRDYFWFIIGDDGTLYPLFGQDDAVADFSSNMPKSERFRKSNGCEYSTLESCDDYWGNSQSTNTSATCKKDGKSWGLGCAARIIEEGWKMNY